MKYKIIIGFFLCLNVNLIYGQDPHFTQFFMAPSFVNPALTGASISDWRLMSNHRQQWGNAGTPYTTTAVTGEFRLLSKKLKDNILAFSGSVMSDVSLNGSFRSNYVSGSLAYHQNIGEYSSLGIGFVGQYSTRRIDIGSLTFGDQFTSRGIDITIPTGETAITPMKPYFNVGSGLLFRINRDQLNVSIGTGVYNINRPARSFLSNSQEKLSPRYFSNLNVEYNYSDAMILNFNSIFLSQNAQSYVAVGGSAGFDMSNGERRNILYTGVWYRSIDAISPYLGMNINNIQIGASYDVVLSKQTRGPINPNSLEISTIIRAKRKIPGVIPCPWF